MIATDIDNTVCETTLSIWRATERDLGLVAGSVPLPVQYDDVGSGFPDPEVARKLIRRRYDGLCQRTLLGADAVPEAREVLSALWHAGLFSGYVTRRPARDEHVTRRWLRAQGLPDAPLIHARGNKADALRDLGALALIEDAPHEAAQVAQTHAVALLHRPYNAGMTGPGLYPFTRWRDLPVQALLARRAA